MRVPFLDLGAAYRELAPELDAAYGEVMASGRFLFAEQLKPSRPNSPPTVGQGTPPGVGSGFEAEEVAKSVLA